MKIRKPLKITSRTSSITNSFVQAIIPVFAPTQAEEDEAFSILGMTRSDLRCVYCGTPSTDWDHLRPLVKNKQPSGYISEIGNLVPSCGRCNQSKGGAEWKNWMQGDAKNSPTSRHITDLKVRIQRLEAFEAWGNVTKKEFSTLVPQELWEQHWNNLKEIEHKMKTAQAVAERLRITLQTSLERERSASE